MCPIQVCPSPEQLSDYIIGKLNEQEWEFITDHMKICGDCLSRLDNLDDPSDLILRKLRCASPDDLYMNEPQCQEAIEASRGIGRKGAAGDEDYDLLGNYRLLKPPLSKGGMGIVYRAMHTKLKKERAVKVLSPERMNNPDSVSRFEREMEAIAKLDHPNIVQAYDAGEEGGQHYLAMELVHGLHGHAVGRHKGT